MSLSQLRIGHGYDVHKFADVYDPSKPLVLAGQLLPDELSLLAHSDGDVVLHAICDALLGALAEGDIGLLFPDTDPSIAGIQSTQILDTVMQKLRSAAGQIINIDVTVVAQIPKIAPHRDVLKKSLSLLLGLDPARVNLKATTTERLGFIGRKEGMACHCVVLIELGK